MEFFVRGNRMDLHRFDGQTVVVVILDGWNPEAAALGKIRAELRGLGAALLMFSDTGFWGFGADDDVDLLASPAEVGEGVLGAIRRDWGVPSGFAVFVVDGHRIVRFARSHQGSDAGADTVVAALSEAGRALLEPPPATKGLTRRELLNACLIAGFATALQACTRAPRRAAPKSSAPPSLAPATMGTDLDITLTVNDVPHALRIDPRVSLLDALRERLGLMGTKKGCDHGQCGACTVLVDGVRVNSCLTLAVMVQGAKVTTVEGMMSGDQLHPLQEAFIAEDAFQCGYCTPGQLVSALGLLRERRELSEDSIREHMSGNLCRCGAYPNIVRAIMRARKEA
jgi:xanthine dehydrogenase YagT iron-sulfur-binding subunit